MMKPNTFSLSPRRRASGLERGQHHRVYELSPNRSVRKVRVGYGGEEAGEVPDLLPRCLLEKALEAPAGLL